MASPTAAEAQHRVEFVKLAARGWRALGSTPMSRATVRDLFVAVRQELVQRRVEQPDRDRQSLHDLEQLDEVAALHRQELVERPRAAAFSSSARIISRTARIRASSKNMCSVRQRPMPSAPNLTRHARIRRRVGIGAHAKLRALSAQPIRVPNSPDIAGSVIGTLPASTWPVEPSMVTMSPS